MALTTLAQIKGFLNIPSSNTSQDEWLEILRASAEASIKNYCNRDFEVATYTEYYTGQGKNYLVLRQTPVNSITSLHLDHDAHFGTGNDPFSSADLLVEGTDFVLDREKAGRSLTGIVWRINDVWPTWARTVRPGTVGINWDPSQGNIKVVYSAGYSSIPEDIKLAVSLLVASTRRSAPQGAELFSERIGDYSYEMAGERMMGTLPGIGSIRQLLSKYKDPAFI